MSIRLLHQLEVGKLVWKEFTKDDTPPYAILSHTWGDDEITFKDLENGSWEGKAGSEKVLFCGKRAAIDGLNYFWVDTCCIDKRDLTELSRAINSMFR